MIKSEKPTDRLYDKVHMRFADAIPAGCVRTRTNAPAGSGFRPAMPPTQSRGTRPIVAARAHLACDYVDRVGPQFSDHEASADGVAAAVLARPVRHHRCCGAGVVRAGAARETERATGDVAAAAAGFDADDRRLGRLHGARSVVAQRQRGRGTRNFYPGLGGVPGLADSRRATVAGPRRLADGCPGRYCRADRRQRLRGQHREAARHIVRAGGRGVRRARHRA